jgi:redox-sensitive bicupin YhaK (pirin superfamily)
MMQLRPASERGRAEHGWLSTAFSFSFADYVDPEHMGFRGLRVINEDHVAPATGFPKHGHRDMEILTWVLSGALRHEDSLGNGDVIRPGEMQRMTAGKGILHSEFNPSPDEPVHLLQIWIHPERSGLEPSWEQRDFGADAPANGLQLLASPDARDGSLCIHADALVSVLRLEPGNEQDYELAPGRHLWLQVARGALSVNGTVLTQGDGLAVSDEPVLRLAASAEGVEALLFDLR